MNNNIELYQVRTHNLKNISVSIPKNQITVIYGRSGAGKSSLAFSTLHQLCADEFEAMEMVLVITKIISLMDIVALFPVLRLIKPIKIIIHVLHFIRFKYGTNHFCS